MKMGYSLLQLTKELIISAIASISTGTPRGNEFTPTAERACSKGKDTKS